jgi:DNA-binding HxlR family transcriptional regulator
VFPKWVEGFVLMSLRTYGQYCGLAAAMDLVGQRWAMLIVRDLSPGPRRFTDLFEGLPGIATDVLAERLRAMEDAGVVRHRTVKHPVPAKVYELTASGVELASIARGLGGWGARLLPAAGSTEARINFRWALQSMAAGYRGSVPDGAYVVVVDDEELSVVVDGPAARVEYGTSGTPVLTVRCDVRQFFTIARDPAKVRTLRRGLSIDGSVEQAEALFSSMPLRVGSGS